MSNRICSAVQEIVTLLSALAHPTRLRLLALIGQSEFCVCYLQEVLKTSQPEVSRHLRILRNAGLVASRKEGKWMHYRRLALPGAQQRIVMQCMLAVLTSTEGQLDQAKMRKLVAESKGADGQ